MMSFKRIVLLHPLSTEINLFQNDMSIQHILHCNSNECCLNDIMELLFYSLPEECQVDNQQNEA